MQPAQKSASRRSAKVSAKNGVGTRDGVCVRRLAALAVAASVGLSFSLARAQDAPQSTGGSDTAALLERVKELEAKVDKLEASQKENKATEDAEIDYIRRDTEAHSQLFQTLPPLSSGYDPTTGFVIRSDDGAFSLRPGLVLDIRNMTSYRENIAKGGGGEVAKVGDDTQNGFDLTRLRLTLAGNYTKNVDYFLQFQDDQGTAFGLLDAYIQYHLGDGSPLSLKVGQFKDPLWHERNLSEANLLAVDRSLVESLLGGGQTGRVQGVAVMYDRDRVRLQGVVHDGFNSLNTKFFTAGGLAGGVGGGAGVTPTDYGVSARGEYLILGKRSDDQHPFHQYDGGFTALGAKQDILVAGAGADYSEAGSNDVFFHTADLQYNTVSGFSAYAAYLGAYRDLHANQGVAPGNFYDPGFVLQAAYLVTDKIEPFARYDYTYLSGKSEAKSLGVVDHAVQEFTIGANYYLYHQNLKFTLDGNWLPDGAPSDTDALGVLKDSGHNEFIVRAQCQLAL
jgi:hypothetical protein